MGTDLDFDESKQLTIITTKADDLHTRAGQMKTQKQNHTD